VQPSVFAFLEKLLIAPGPVGSEGPVQEVFRAYLEPHADELVMFPHGSVAAIRNPEGSPRVIVTGHADEIGLVAHHVDDRGFVFVRNLGGIDPAPVVGALMEVHTAKGVIPAVVGRKPIHLQEADDRTKVPKVKELYLDVGAGSREEAEKRIRPGDPVTFRPGVTHLSKDLVTSKAMDNRAGVFCAAEALRRLGKTKPKACVIALSTVGEEIGGDGALTAAHDLEPDVAIAIDVTFATDQPDVSEKDTCVVHLGKGPVVARGPRLNRAVERLLVKAATKKKIPLQYEVLEGRTGTDGDPIYRTRGGVPLGIVSVPSRYMHTPVEVVSLADLDRIADLLSTFVRDLTPSTEFDPF
jgi:endoglucanase